MTESLSASTAEDWTEPTLDAGELVLCARHCGDGLVGGRRLFDEPRFIASSN